MPDCPYHEDHTHRIEVLEDSMKTLQEERVSFGRWVAAAAFFGTAMTGTASFIGVLVGLWAKAHGYFGG